MESPANTRRIGGTHPVIQLTVTARAAISNNRESLFLFVRLRARCLFIPDRQPSRSAFPLESA